jgi:hypothetical protein
LAVFSITENKGKNSENLFFDFLVLSLFSAPFAEFFKLNLFSDEFLVLAGPVIYALAGSAAKFYKSIL